MAGPVRLQSWWEVAFLIAFVFIIGMSQVSPFWKHWGGPIIIAMFVVTAVGVVRSDERK